nr:putative transcriptional regulatory protein [Quercus suber]
MPDSEVPSHRACAHCRSQKVRCIVDDATPDQCQRCSRSGRPCIFTPVQRRKQRKRTDTRVAELEREMRAMRSLIKNQQDGAESTTPPSYRASTEVPKISHTGDVLSDGEPGSLTFVQSARRPISRPPPRTHSGDAEPTSASWQPKASVSESPANLVSDVVSRAVLSLETARQLFSTYQDLY